MERRRARIALLIFSAVVVNYVDRIALSVASKPIAEEFGLSPVQMGYLFSCFLWTYVVCLVPMGLLADRMSPRLVVGGGLGIWSAATAAMAAANGFGAILAARLVMGASEATTFPACGRIVREWFPRGERGLVTTLFNGGSTAGPAIGAVLTGALVATVGWRAAFVVLGLLGFAWLAAWLRWFDRPEDARWLGEAERHEILTERAGPTAGSSDAAPRASSIVRLVSQPPVWGLMLTQACLVYTAYLFLTWLPTFLQTNHALSTADSGYVTALPYLATLGLGLLVARASDRALSSADVAAGRRRNAVAAMALTAAPIVVASHVDSVWQLVPLLTLVLTGSTTGAGLNFTLASDLLENPRDAARITALVALGGNAFGLAAPIITGYVVARTGGYDWAFRIAAALLVLGALSALLLTRRPIAAEAVPNEGHPHPASRRT